MDINKILKVVSSKIWVGNEVLISALIKFLVENKIRVSNNRDLECFWAIVCDEADSFQGTSTDIFEAIVNRETLQTLVESGLWTLDSRIMWFIYTRFLQLSVAEQDGFGNDAFWNALYDHEQIGRGGRAVGEYFTVGEEHRVRVKRFKAEGASHSVKFRHVDELRDFPNLLPQIFDNLLENILRNYNDCDKVGLEIIHPNLKANILVPFRKKEEISSESILHLLERIVQSQESFTFDERLLVKVVAVSSVQGGSNAKNSRSTIVNWNKWFEKHCGHGGCFLQIKNDDNICLARAVVVAKAKIDKNPQWNSIRQGDHNRSVMQKQLAKQLMTDAGLGGHNGLCGIEEVKKIQEFLEPEYQIKIFSKDHFNSLIYKGSEAEKVLHLFYHDNHFDVITKVPAFMGKSYFCENCNKGYNTTSHHVCKRGKCSACNDENECNFEDWKHCQNCNRYFLSGACFDNHKKNRKMLGNGKLRKITSQCESISRCKDCNRLLRIDKRKSHKCENFYCKVCRVNDDKTTHECYMKFDKDKYDKKQKKTPKFIFFDFETRQDDFLKENSYGHVNKHIPNCCVAYRRCDKCKDKPIGNCASCGGENRWIFLGDSCLDDFGDWLFSEENRGAIGIAHNAKSFDAQFLLEYLHKQKTQSPKIISRGLEIMSLEAGGVKIIDTLNFLPMSLSEFPKAFGVQNMKKGHFPHFFNTRANWNYVGPMPAITYYGIDTMKENQRNDLLKWYEAAKDDVFDFQKELLEYCESDVQILATCTFKFREIFMATTGVDPFIHSLTIASACNVVFRRNFLNPNTIGIVPHLGYRREENQSIVALKWLKYVSHRENIQIRHKLNGGEIKIGKYKVDGLCGKTVYEFYGCFWHGCKDCMIRRQEVVTDRTKTAEEAYLATIDRKTYLEALGYTVVEQWECQLRKELAKNKTMADFFKNVEIIEPMGPREAFYGGRTNAVKLFHHCSKGEKIMYIDVCSLYPFICKTGIFPLGHPQIITENFHDLTTQPYTGVIKCTVIPPRGLYHPVLPFRSEGKLLFPLCRTCAENRTDVCAHTDIERAITGSWVTLEVYKALEKGYRVAKIYEVWHYEETEKYDPVSKTGGLFSEYINTFLKMKQEADGWPQWVQTDDDKTNYIRLYEEREGIRLDTSKIQKNPGMRALAKLMLNSFWGKFGQRNNLSKTEYFDDPEKFYAVMNDPTKEVACVRFYGESLACVNYMVKDDVLDPLSTTNPVIAAFVTCQARLELYKYLDLLQERVLYFDTDSIIYLTKEGQPEVPTGSFLGDMTNELAGYGPDAYISEFLGGGPKNYGYRVTNGKNDLGEVLKVRGIRLSYENKKTVNFDQLKLMIHGFGSRNPIVKTIIEKKILRDGERNVFTSMCKKDYRVVYDKRNLVEDYCTLPFGY